jgi:hypothetical protein
VREGTDENFTICPSRQSGQYVRNDATSFLGHHISATFELRAGVVKARRPAAAGRSEAKSLEDAEHSLMLSM